MRVVKCLERPRLVCRDRTSMYKMVILTLLLRITKAGSPTNIREDVSQIICSELVVVVVLVVSVALVVAEAGGGGRVAVGALVVVLVGSTLQLQCCNQSTNRHEVNTQTGLVHGLSAGARMQPRRGRRVHDWQELSQDSEQLQEPLQSSLY